MDSHLLIAMPRRDAGVVPFNGIFQNLAAIVVPILLASAACGFVVAFKRQAVWAFLRKIRGKRSRVVTMSSRGQQNKDLSGNGSNSLAMSEANSQDVVIFMPSGVTADVLGAASEKQLAALVAKNNALIARDDDDAKPAYYGPAEPPSADRRGGWRGGWTHLLPLVNKGASPSSSSQHSLPSHRGNASDWSRDSHTPQGNPRNSALLYPKPVSTLPRQPLHASAAARAPEMGPGAHRGARGGKRAWEPVVQRWRAEDELQEARGERSVECSVSPGISFKLVSSPSAASNTLTLSDMHSVLASCVSNGSPGQRGAISLRAERMSAGGEGNASGLCVWRCKDDREMAAAGARGEPQICAERMSARWGNASGLCVWRCKDDRELAAAGARGEPPREVVTNQLCDLQDIVLTSPVPSLKQPLLQCLLNDAQAAADRGARLAAGEGARVARHLPYGSGPHFC